jgi:hypothetical protein
MFGYWYHSVNRISYDLTQVIPLSGAHYSWIFVSVLFHRCTVVETLQGRGSLTFFGKFENSFEGGVLGVPEVVCFSHFY